MAVARRIGLLFMLSCMTGFISIISASGTFHVTGDVRTAYTNVLQLKLSDAEKVARAVQLKEPENLMALYILDFVDFLHVMIEDDLDEYQAIKSDRETRMRLMSLGDVSSPFYLYVQAEMYIHRGMLRMKFGENFNAAADLNQAFRLLKRNQRRFPTFSPNLKSLGMLKAAFGTIPDSYRWAVELMSNMEGTVDEGLKDIQSSLKDRNQFAYREAQYCYILALFGFQNKPSAALDYARMSGMKPAANVLECFMLSHIALKSGHNDEALEWLEKRISEPGVVPVPQLDLLYGTAKLNRLDTDADVPLHRFLDNYQGKSYRKEALQKLAWHALLGGDQSAYQKYMTQCEFSGSAVNEADLYALSEAHKVRLPNVGLLKARLLFNGGYYLKALEEVEKVTFDELSSSGQLEYRYRSGRIYQELGREYDALFAYKTTISGSVNSTEYFGCASALYAGLLYEAKGEKDNAKHYFDICLSMEPDEYEAGLHQKAKAGLSRMKQ